MTGRCITALSALPARSAGLVLCAAVLCMTTALPATAGIVKFDVKDAVATDPTAINVDGTITGSYEDPAFATHGFVRAADGKIKSFDAIGAIATLPGAISGKSAITGFYADGSFVFHGFVRSPHGVVTSFDPAGSIQVMGPNA